MCSGDQPQAPSSRRLRRCFPSTPFLLLAYLSYLLLGSAAFWALESPAEREASRELLQEKWDLLENYSCLEREALEHLAKVGISRSSNAIQVEIVHKVILEDLEIPREVSKGIIRAYKTGLYIKENATLGRWDFVGSFFFSVSAVTTIGYGNLSPSTEVAQILCIFFALFGIPLNLILLNRIGQLMLSAVQLCAFRLGEKFQWQKGAAVLTRTCALVAGLLLFFLLPPLLFTAIEGWTYEEGFYYSFITLSTIGFGDYVIGMNPERTYPTWYKNVVSLWILFGMAWLALIINLCISLLENSSGLCQCCKRRSREMEQDLNNANPNNLGPEDKNNHNEKDTKLVVPN